MASVIARSIEHGAWSEEQKGDRGCREMIILIKKTNITEG